MEGRLWTSAHVDTTRFSESDESAHEKSIKDTDNSCHGGDELVDQI
jgi:hypothetical protein